ncbi:MAG: hypothetical protein JJE12_10350 [Anaerolineales bacterium]|nr:hypothetical protein [Anaerolineales bacterium]
MSPSTITGINNLPVREKREIYAHMIPPALNDYFNLPEYYIDQNGNDLLSFKYSPGSPSVEMVLKHQIDFPDPIQYGHLTDTLNGQIHVLLYILNDPASPRFNVDQLPDGQKTVFGTKNRNIEAEMAALEAGLAPGQVRRGLRMLSKAIVSFEKFVTSLNHEIYFVEPLYYHNAAIFEKYGFAYQKGRKLMERIQSGFSQGGDLLQKLDPSNTFRPPDAASSFRLRSWALHDDILGEPFSDVTMYKYVGKSANVSTCTACIW